MEATNNEELSKTQVNGETPQVLEAMIASPVEHQGQRVITLSMMDQAHGRPSGTAGRNFRANRARLIEGQEYFLVTPPADEIRRPDGTLRGAEQQVLLTEGGYLLLVKSFRDELAWKVQRTLVETYFRAREPAQLGQYGLDRKTEMVVGAIADRIAAPIIGKLVSVEVRLTALEERQARSVTDLLREQQERRTDQSFIPPWAARVIRHTITQHAKAITRNNPDPKAYRRQRGADELSLRIQFGFYGAGKRWEIFPVSDWPRMSNRLEELQRETGRIRCGTQLALSLADVPATADVPGANPSVQPSPPPAPPLLS